ncbi:MAG: thioredoxin domain-containing protein [Thermodesulfovibrio sp.]|nr:thioredoxin domain-containing protein [Thermodesulfovibrio sp.]
MKPNRLINEKSPYLRQHAYNPVDWYPWCKEAFSKALEQDKPIFLSIGYSTCHWCHVMEKECFEDHEIADILNKNFISIKVDREERPDIDNIYMKACYLFNQRGGWPLTVIMTPHKKPFFVDTYIPKDDRYGRLGLKSILLKIVEIWKKERKRIFEISDSIAEALTHIKSKVEDKELSKELIEKAYYELKEQFDKDFGGFGLAPKFPMPLNMIFLHRFYHRNKIKDALEMSTKTLESMAKGGIYDQIGGGFHRYSTDSYWIVPHFEKMLHDNALLIMAYTEAYAITKNSFFKKIIEDTVSFLEREMLSPKGGFYSALDADTEGKEGEFYLWRLDEIREILNDKEFLVAELAFGISDEGNFFDEVKRTKTGKNIIYFAKDPKKIADELRISAEEVENIIDRIKIKLFNVREGRVKPFRDEKILTDWNSLLVAALSRAYLVIEDDRLIRLAKECLDFILKNMFDSEGRLLHVYKDEEASVFAYLEDYAYLIWALIDYYLCSFDAYYLRESIRLLEDVISYFWDFERGGFYQTAHYSEIVISRNKEIYDGVLPSGNSVMAYNLVRLSRLVQESKYEDLANSLFRAFSGEISRHPSAYLFSLVAFELMTYGTKEIIVIPLSWKEDLEFLRKLQKNFLPELLIIVKNSDTESFIPNIREKDIINEKTTYYFCLNRSCQRPTNDKNQILSLIFS